MAGALKVKNGSRMVMAYDVPVGSDPQFNMNCTYVKGLDEASFLVSIPMKDGKLMEMDENQKLLIRCGNGADAQILAGYVDDVVRQGLRSYWKIRRVSESRQFFQRADERIKVALRVEYMQDTWPLNFEGNIDPEEGLTVDISAGGLAMYLNHRFEVGEICEVMLPDIGRTDSGRNPGELIAVACWTREAPRGSVYRNVAGFQFRLEEGPERERVKDYVSYVKKRYRL